MLHIGWAKPMVSTCSKFESEVRAKVDLPKDQDEDDEDVDEGISSSGTAAPSLSPGSSIPQSPSSLSPVSARNNNVYKDKKAEDEENQEEESCDDVLLRRLSDGCKENLLNVDYLLGRRSASPFLLNLSQSHECDPLSGLRRRNRKRLLRNKLRRKRQADMALSESSISLSPTTTSSSSSGGGGLLQVVSSSSNASLVVSGPPPTQLLLRLRSAKMQGLQGLLCSEKINTSAIQLQLTAQSQVGGGLKTETSSLSEGRPKRARRE